MDGDSKAEMSFWDHLDALRGVLLRSAGLVLVLALLSLGCYLFHPFGFFLS